jgi:hypothetical protein
MSSPLECAICAARWFSARFQGNVDLRGEQCPDCGGPLVRAGAEPVVRSRATIGTAQTIEFNRIGPQQRTA